MSCGEAGTNANFNAAPVTAWKALHASKELAPGAAPLAGRDVGFTRGDGCVLGSHDLRLRRLQDERGAAAVTCAYDINSAECQQGILGVQCFITDTHVTADNP